MSKAYWLKPGMEFVVKPTFQDLGRRLPDIPDLVCREHGPEVSLEERISNCLRLEIHILSENKGVSLCFWDIGFMRAAVREL